MPKCLGLFARRHTLNYRRLQSAYRTVFCASLLYSDTYLISKINARAAALATGCRVDLKLEAPYFDLHQNPVLGAYISVLFLESAFLLRFQRKTSLISLEAGMVWWPTQMTHRPRRILCVSFPTMEG